MSSRFAPLSNDDFLMAANAGGGCHKPSIDADLDYKNRCLSSFLGGIQPSSICFTNVEGYAINPPIRLGGHTGLAAGDR